MTEDLPNRVAEAVAKQARAAKSKRFKERMERRAYSVEEVAQQLGVNRSTVWRWCKSTPPHIRSVTVSGRVLIPVTEVDRLLGDPAA
jgi:excisionase family DNA binding protein